MVDVTHPRCHAGHVARKTGFVQRIPLLEAHYLEGVSVTELAIELGCSRNAVLIRLSRARERARRVYVDESGESDESADLDTTARPA